MPADRSRVAIAALVVALALPLAAQAAPFSQLIVFGDNLSDNGNVFAATGGSYPPPPYAQRFSNGPVAVEYLAASLAIPLVNDAYGGATTGRALSGPNPQPNFINATGFPAPVLPNIGDEVDQYLGTTPVDPNALYIIWGGPNDIFLAQFLNSNPLTLDAELQAAAMTAVVNLVTYAGTFSTFGAQFILVPGMPDLGLTPAYNGGPRQAAMSALTGAFNTNLRNGLLAIPNARFFDTDAALRQMIANPAAYGFTNVTKSCLDTPACFGSPAANWNDYLFWDAAHLTSRGHQALGEEFAASAVPEPASLLLLGTGLAGLMARRRFRA